jgi:hypothetical protein
LRSRRSWQPATEVRDALVLDRLIRRYTRDTVTETWISASRTVRKNANITHPPAGTMSDARTYSLGPEDRISVTDSRSLGRGSSPAAIAAGAGLGRIAVAAATRDRYRSDVLIAWQQGGSIYAHMLRDSGRSEPTQRVGASAPDPRLQALVSDDNHGMIAWW